MSSILGALALLLTVSGLFSVLSYLVEQRTREIGVRMALGATSQNVTQLMLAQTARPVIIGLIAGAGLAAVLATAMMATRGAYIAEIVRVADPLAYAVSLSVIVAACLVAAWIPAARAAKVVVTTSPATDPQLPRRDRKTRVPSSHAVRFPRSRSPSTPRLRRSTTCRNGCSPL